MAATDGKALKPWDRRLWPDVGDADPNTTYAAVGRALSQWERYEAVLSLLFSALLKEPLDSNTAYRSYSAVRTFEGRTEMLRAASTSYFAQNDDSKNQEIFGAIIRDAKNYSPRRNDIAHGVLDPFHKEDELPPQRPSYPIPYTYGMFPSHATFKDRTVKNLPMYCYTAAELDYFSNEFRQIQFKPVVMAGELMVQTQHESFRKKSP